MRSREDFSLTCHYSLHYPNPAQAFYPCLLKGAEGCHGCHVHLLVRCVADVEDLTGHDADAFDSAHWLLCEMVRGRFECSTTLLVCDGVIHDAVCTVYDYGSDEYIWPYAKEVSRASHDEVPQAHLEVMRAFVDGYSGVCNFNYKVREDGCVAIFEMNTRIGADLAVDMPRPRAAILLEKLDALGGSNRPRRQTAGSVA